MDWLMPATSLSLFHPKMAKKLPFLAQNRDFLGHFGTSLTPRTPSTGGFNSGQPKNEQKEYQILIS